MGKTYGYVRVSTKKQKLERQVDNILDVYPGAIIIEEKYTGTKMDRPKWLKLYANLVRGDKVIFDEVSRMSRNSAEGFQTYKELYNRGVELVFLKESTLNTENFRATEQIAMTGTDVDCILRGVNEYLMILAENQIRSAFQTAQIEVERLHERVSEGVQKRMKIYQRELIEGTEHEKNMPGIAKGTKLVTKKSISAKEEIRKYSKKFNGTLNDTECMKMIKLSRNTYYKYVREMNEE